MSAETERLCFRLAWAIYEAIEHTAFRYASRRYVGDKAGIRAAKAELDAATDRWRTFIVGGTCFIDMGGEK